MKQGRPKGGMSEYTRRLRERVNADKLIDTLEAIAFNKKANPSDRISAARELLSRLVPTLKSQEVTIDNPGIEALTPDEQLEVRKFIIDRRAKDNIVPLSNTK